MLQPVSKTSLCGDDAALTMQRPVIRGSAGGQRLKGVDGIQSKRKPVLRFAREPAKPSTPLIRIGVGLGSATMCGKHRGERQRSTDARQARLRLVCCLLATAPE